MGATASRLVCAHNQSFEECERRVCDFKECQSALVFNSGYGANTGILPALADNKTMFLLDRLCHASLVDGVLLSGAKWSRYGHNDLDGLERLLKKHSAIKKKIVVTESVFSMDGDRAPLADLHGLCERYQAYLYVDEAHGSGVVGKQAQGLVCEAGLSQSPRVIGMGTFGKALGSYGAYFFGSQLIKDWLINRARSFIFSTALPPPVLGANIAALKILKKHPEFGRQVLSKAAAFRANLKSRGLPLICGDTQIVSIATGSNQDTLACSDFLKTRGLLGIGIRPPAVPPGTGRIRVAINRGHTPKELDRLAEALERYFKTREPLEKIVR